VVSDAIHLSGGEHHDATNDGGVLAVSLAVVSLAVSLAVVKTRVLLGDDGDYGRLLDYDFQQNMYRYVARRKKIAPGKVDPRDP
jgi:hypothetical protein